MQTARKLCKHGDSTEQSSVVFEFGIFQAGKQDLEIFLRLLWKIPVLILSVITEACVVSVAFNIIQWKNRIAKR